MSAKRATAIIFAALFTFVAVTAGIGSVVADAQGTATETVATQR